MYKEKYKKIKFPQDEQKHDHIIEWWYFNGNLKAKNKQTFSYMNCLFNTKPKKVNIPILKKIKINNLFFSHSLLSDNKKNFIHKVDPICIMNENSFKKPLLWAQYNNSCLIEELEPFKYHIVNDFIDLTLESTKKPLLLNKNGFLDLKMKTTYYYSLTNLKTKGYVKHKNEWIVVEGLSWMDHQWAQTPLTEDDKWIWYSIQLDNGIEIVCFEYGEDEKTTHASMIDKNGNIKSFDNVIFKKIGAPFKSETTGTSYELKNKITIPELNLELESIPFNKSQEMIFGNISYWEGGVEIKGKLNGKAVKGKGFLEIAKRVKDVKKIVNLTKGIDKKSIKEKLKSLTKMSTNSINNLIEKL